MSFVPTRSISPFACQISPNNWDINYPLRISLAYEFPVFEITHDHRYVRQKYRRDTRSEIISKEVSKYASRSVYSDSLTFFVINFITDRCFAIEYAPMRIDVHVIRFITQRKLRMQCVTRTCSKLARSKTFRQSSISTTRRGEL